jgi:DNA-binding response OmpR family regulator
MVELAPDISPERRVLVVEDEPQICDLLTDVLQDDGFTPHCVRSDRRRSKRSGTTPPTPA